MERNRDGCLQYIWVFPGRLSVLRLQTQHSQTERRCHILSSRCMSQHYPYSRPSLPSHPQQSPHQKQSRLLSSWPGTRPPPCNQLAEEVRSPQPPYATPLTTSRLGRRLPQHDAQEWRNRQELRPQWRNNRLLPRWRRLGQCSLGCEICCDEVQPLRDHPVRS